MISPAVLAAVKDLDTKIRNGTVFVEEDAVTYGYEDLCERLQPPVNTAIR